MSSEEDNDPHVCFINDSDGSNPCRTLDEIVNRVKLLPSAKSNCVVLDCAKDRSLLIFYIKDFGYYVTGTFEDEGNYFVLVDYTLGDKLVIATIDADERAIYRFVFVSEEVVVRAVTTYYMTGKRDKSLDWLVETDVL